MSEDCPSNDMPINVTERRDTIAAADVADARMAPFACLAD